MAEAPPPISAKKLSNAPVSAGGPGVAAKPTESTAPVAEGTMLDIEGKVVMEVDHVAEAGERVRALTASARGMVVEDTFTGTLRNGTERITIRLPSGGADTFLKSIEGLGKVRSREVNVRDVGKEFYDAQLQLHNLEAAMKRYEEILPRAKEVKEVLMIEAELTRIRGEIEAVKGNLRFVADRAARATITVTLEASPTVEVDTPTARIFPGLRFSAPYDLRGGGKSAGYLGVGLSLRFGRFFSIDLDGFQSPTSPTSGLDAMLLTAGGEFYSQFFGDGHRRWLNPYLGFRGGWAHMLGKDEFAFGATGGVEIFKSKAVFFDAELRSFALVANKDVTPHAVLQPSLSAHFSF